MDQVCIRYCYKLFSCDGPSVHHVLLQVLFQYRHEMEQVYFRCCCKLLQVLKLKVRHFGLCLFCVIVEEIVAHPQSPESAPMHEDMYGWIKNRKKSKKAQPIQVLRKSGKHYLMVYYNIT